MTVGGSVPTITMSTEWSPRSEIRWREWSKAAFDQAAKESKLVLLDLSAVWCHWCHVMDGTTYSDKDVADTINRSFIPVRVDIDERPDISERYNRGGFPTTAFLSDRAESIWGATYVPPADMKRIMKSVLAAKASGEIDRALEKTRLQYLDISKRFRPRQDIEAGAISSVFEDIFSIYDVEFGGFGTQPKFPHPDALDLLLHEYIATGDKDLSKAVERTLDMMVEGIFDQVEGGLFRYSVTRDWRTPHYEKMLETNLGFLRNLVHASIALDSKRYADLARQDVKYILKWLRDSRNGGFYGSQEADEGFYKLSPEARSKADAPPVDKRIYAGWNAEAISTLIEAGALLGEPSWIEAGLGAWKYTLENLWNPDLGLIRHMVNHKDYLFEDQVAFLHGGLAVLEVSRSEEAIRTIEALIAGVEQSFTASEGGYGDIISSGDSVGELDSARRSLVANSKWARAVALFGAATHNDSLIEKAGSTLASFTIDEVESHGLFGAAFITSSRTMQHGPALVEVHGGDTVPWTNALWTAAKKAADPGTVVLLSAEEHSNRPYALICTPVGCSAQIFDPESLAGAVKRRETSQA